MTPPATVEAERKKIDPFITWSGSYCKACLTCVHICPVDNLELQNDEMISLGKCIQCMLCMKYCPDFAIEVEPKQKSEPGLSSADKEKKRAKK